MAEDLKQPLHPRRLSARRFVSCLYRCITFFPAEMRVSEANIIVMSVQVLHKHMKCVWAAAGPADQPAASTAQAASWPERLGAEGDLEHAAMRLLNTNDSTDTPGSPGPTPSLRLQWNAAFAF